MKANKNHSFAIKFAIVLCTLGFTFYAVFAPSAFAQQKKKNNTPTTQQYMQLINSIFGFVMQNYVDDVDPEVLYSGALKGMMDALDDPYTQYLDSSSMRGLSDTTVGEFGGVGLSISKPLTSTPEKPAYVEVVSPIEGGPGYKAGIQAGDYIIAINETSTPDITMDEVLKMLRGTVGEKVNVTVKRGKNVVFKVDLIREIIEVPTVKYGMIDNAGQKIGYIKIIEFTPLTPEKIDAAIDSFGNKYDGLIIDLRNNPGGLITSVRDVADRFIEDGIIVYTKDRKGDVIDMFSATPSKTIVRDKPIVVLINKGSASASEILSGALKDHKLAYLMGERSYGKGSVQQLFPLYNNDGVKITIARYYTPSDVNIDKIGIPPDREVKLFEFTEDEEKIYAELVKDEAIVKYAETHKITGEKEIALAAKELQKKYNLDERFLRRLVRLEAYRTRDPLLYDLDFDNQLREALKVLAQDDFSELVSNTLTLKELQNKAISEQKDKDSDKK